MNRESVEYGACLEVLRRELTPAMGCTEPVAIALCAAKARALLGELPGEAEVLVSGNILKNARSVVVPQTGGRRGIEVAAAIGILAGQEDKLLEVLCEVDEAARAKLDGYMRSLALRVRPSERGCLFDIEVRVRAGTRSAAARIEGGHTNFVRLERDGEALPGCEQVPESGEEGAGYGCLTVRAILDFAACAEAEDVAPVLERQISLNTAIAREGLRGDYGANIGSVLLDAYGPDIRNRAKAMAAAGSDARMGGCSLPVVINSGSGNQGLTASLPVIEFASALGAGHERLLRALIVSNLIAIHLKSKIGCLSAYCGAVSAGAAAGAGIAWLSGGGFEEVAHTVVNALAITSGIVCDGAKASCAAKIASAVDAGILGYEMYRRGQQFYAGDGLILKGVENTIDNIARLGRVAMRETDREIVHMMTCVD